MSNETKKVLIGSPILQKPEILDEYLKSLSRLDKQDLYVEYMFVDDNVDEKSRELLAKFGSDNLHVNIIEGKNVNEYKCDDQTHYWNNELMNKVGEFKNKIIYYAVENGFDYLFFSDSDLVINSNLLQHLISTDKDIVSEIFWTQWTPNTLPAPNVWLYDQYNMSESKFGERLTAEQSMIRKMEFINKLRIPGLYKVGGLGACTLLSRKALLKGVNFSPINNLRALVGEDRFFCVRAVAMGIDLWVDTRYPAYHIYRESDLEGVAEYVAEN